MINNANNSRALFTIGHSAHELAGFVALLKQHKVSAIADVRSQPYARYTPQYNREPLQAALQLEGIRYVFLGSELGARRAERECYEDGKALYERIVQTSAFTVGLSRIRKGLRDNRLALMCAEKDPLTCHRTILICHALRCDGLDIRHILADGELESMQEAEDRLLSMFSLPTQDLFRSREEILEEAYQRQGNRIAYSELKRNKKEATLR